MLFGKAVARFALDIHQFHLLLLHGEAFRLIEAGGVARQAFRIEILGFLDQGVIGFRVVGSLPFSYDVAVARFACSQPL